MEVKLQDFLPVGQVKEILGSPIEVFFLFFDFCLREEGPLLIKFLHAWAWVSTEDIGFHFVCLALSIAGCHSMK